MIRKFLNSLVWVALGIMIIINVNIQIENQNLGENLNEAKEILQSAKTTLEETQSLYKNAE